MNFSGSRREKIIHLSS